MLFNNLGEFHALRSSGPIWMQLPVYQVPGSKRLRLWNHQLDWICRNSKVHESVNLYLNHLVCFIVCSCRLMAAKSCLAFGKTSLLMVGCSYRVYVLLFLPANSTENLYYLLFPDAGNQISARLTHVITRVVHEVFPMDWCFLPMGSEGVLIICGHTDVHMFYFVNCVLR